MKGMLVHSGIMLLFYDLPALQTGGTELWYYLSTGWNLPPFHSC